MFSQKVMVWKLRILILIESKGLVEAEGAKDLQPNTLHELSEAHRTHRGGRREEVLPNITS